MWLTIQFGVAARLFSDDSISRVQASKKLVIRNGFRGGALAAAAGPCYAKRVMD